MFTDCWAAGAATGGCGHLEKALRDCMDQPVRLFPILATQVVKAYGTDGTLTLSSYRNNHRKTNLRSITISQDYIRISLGRRSGDLDADIQTMFSIIRASSASARQLEGADMRIPEAGIQ